MWKTILRCVPVYSVHMCVPFYVCESVCWTTHMSVLWSVNMYVPVSISVYHACVCVCVCVRVLSTRSCPLLCPSIFVVIKMLIWLLYICVVCVCWYIAKQFVISLNEPIQFKPHPSLSCALGRFHLDDTVYTDVARHYENRYFSPSLHYGWLNHSSLYREVCMSI